MGTHTAKDLDTRLLNNVAGKAAAGLGFAVGAAVGFLLGAAVGAGRGVGVWAKAGVVGVQRMCSALYVGSELGAGV
jgi:outer membrane lipoprotein SlyB